MTAPDPAHNLASRLLAAADIKPDQAALIRGDREVSYGTLRRRVHQTAAALARHGIAGGDRVALLFPNDLRFVEALLAPIHLGAVAVPLNTRGSRRQIEVIVHDARPAVLLATPETAAAASAIAESSGVPVWITDGEEAWVDSAQRQVSLLSESVPAPAAVAEGTVCFQPYTSGSTGTPKGCLLTHGGQWWNASTVRTVWELGSRHRGLVSAPIYHKNALICVVKPMLLSGGSVVIAESGDPATIPEEIARHRCTYMTGVPATYELLLESLADQSRDIGSLEFVICGSAPLSDALGRRISEGLGVRVIEAYGLTEGGPQVLMAPRSGPPRYGSAGRPLPDGEVKLLDVEDMPSGPVSELVDVPDATAGEIWIRNPGVTAGYHRLPEVTRERISVDGWLRTGDLAIRDAEGWYRILGRRDDMMSVGGENVYPSEVETTLTSIPGVRQAVVVAVPHPRKGEVPAAFIRGVGLTESAVKNAAIEQGAAYAHPRHVWFVDEFPLTGAGKTDRQALADRARALLEKKGRRGDREDRT